MAVDAMPGSQIGSRPRMMGRCARIQIACGSLVVAGAALMGVIGPTAAAHLTNSRPYCHYPQHYNTIICPRSKKAAEAYCLNAAEYSAPNSPVIERQGRIVGGGVPGKPAAAYQPGSTSRYRVKFYVSDIKGCVPAGSRRIAFLQELRVGGASYRPNSRTETIVTDNAYRANKSLLAPYDCSAMPEGAEVRLVLRITWHPAAHWGGHPGTRTFLGKPSRIC